jgi:hypothetical protein
MVEQTVVEQGFAGHSIPQYEPATPVVFMHEARLSSPGVW